MKRVAEIVRREQATVTVLSAMSGTTDALVQISKLAADGDLAAIGKVLDMLRDKYSTCIDGLLTATRQKAFDRMEAAWTTILAAATDFQPYTSERTIIAQGELLTSAIFTQYLVESGSDAVCLNAPDFMITDADTKVNAKLLHERLSALTADKKKILRHAGIYLHELSRRDRQPRTRRQRLQCSPDGRCHRRRTGADLDRHRRHA